jgi:hypothetical protein
MIAVSLSQQEEEHSTTSKHTQAHMEDVLGAAHSLLSWHTRHQLTGEFRFQEEESQPSQPAPNSPFFSRPTQFFFILLLLLLVTHYASYDSWMHGQEREAEATKNRNKEKLHQKKHPHLP